MSLTFPRSLACLELRPFSAVLLGVYALLAWAGMGLTGVVVHAAWFTLLLTRSGRQAVLVASVILGAVGLMGCATGTRVTGAPIAGAVLALFTASAWLAARGIDYLESTWHGQATESRVRRVLDGLTAAAPTSRVVRHGVLLRNGRSLTEIDHVLITERGIVVIETKGYVGHIAFEADTNRWWRTKRGGGAEEIEDPLAQNDRHVRAVRRLFPAVAVFSLVVMPRAVLDWSVPSGVVTLSQLRRNLDDWIADRTPPLDVAFISRRLEQEDRASPEDRRAHLNWLQHVHRQRIHPLLQRRLAAFAGTLYFGIPGLLVMSLR